ncbi:high affinity immunoglobulin epsilon receptor subunit alpha [Marmota monax]|nr:high affinity immunoglobulin epsilon receptor subunit alpha [Marmota monax]
MPAAMGGCAPLCIGLLLFSLAGTLTGNRKSILTLNPPWNRIFRGENVTLECKENNSTENSHTVWTHNGTISEVTASKWSIVDATYQHSGIYTCHGRNFYKSKPVYLEVISDWMLLQASAEEVLEGESLFLRCHGWRNWKIKKVIYYKDDMALKYSYENQVFSITNASLNDSGSYFCKGLLQKQPCVSEPLRITVIKAYRTKYMWLQIIVPLLVATLFAVDTGLFFLTEQQFKSLLKIKETEKVNKPRKSLPKPDPEKS